MTETTEQTKERRRILIQGLVGEYLAGLGDAPGRLAQAIADSDNEEGMMTVPGDWRMLEPAERKAYLKANPPEGYRLIDEETYLHLRAISDNCQCPRKEGYALVPVELLQWAVKNFDCLVTPDNGHGSFIRGTRTELAGFGLRVNELRGIIADARIAAAQEEG